MSDLSVQQQKQLSLYLKKNPKISREKAIVLLFGGKAAPTNKGIAVEHSSKQTQSHTIYLQSGRKVVYTKLKDGRMACKYYGADGTQIKPEYFKKVEGKISISNDGTTYCVTKNGKKSKPLKAKSPSLGQLDQNIAKLNNQEKKLNKIKKEQGFIGKGWDWFKNKTGIGDSSDKAQMQINAERDMLKQLRQPNAKIDQKQFEKITGQKYTKANLEKFKKGEFSQASQKVAGYQEGQEMAVDVVADVAAGAASFTIYTLSIAAAPFTGGGSIALGGALAAGTGALVKTGVKYSDAVSGGRKYTLNDAKKDASTGAVSGLLAPITAGAGGAIGKTVATKLGLQTIKTVGKEIAEDVVENGFKQTLKTSMMSPGAFKYVGEGAGKKILAYGSEVVTDGVLNGGIDNGFRTAINGGSFSDVAKATGEGALYAPLVGLGMKGGGFALGKATSLVNKTVKENGFHYIKTPFGNKDFKLTKGQYTRLKLEDNSTTVLRTKNQNPTNLTNELKKGIYQLSDVHALLRNNPNLGRTVGKLPSKWGKAVKSSEAFKKIDDAFSSYAKDFHEGKASKEGLKNLETKLATILNTDVKVAYLGSGSIGSTYKISALGQDYVYKVFYKEGMFSSNHGHGNHSELLSAVQASRLSSKNFARFYMGKFGENQDGYILTKFIPETTKTTNDKGFFSNFLKGMNSLDNHSDNVRNGVILDYGAAKVCDYSNLSPKARKIAREVFSAIDSNSTENMGKIIKKYASNKEFGEVKNLLLRIRDDNFLVNSDVFAKRSEVFSMLGIDYKVDIRKMAGVDPEPYAKYYGLSEKEMWHLENLANARRNEKYKVDNGKKSVTQGKEVIENKRIKLKQKIANGNKVSQNGILSIPKGSLKAPSSKFAETDEAFVNIVHNNKQAILELNKKSGDDFIKGAFALCKKAMGLEDAPIKLKIIGSGSNYSSVGDNMGKSAGIAINRNWQNGNKAELFAAICHELNHQFQYKEMYINSTLNDKHLNMSKNLTDWIDKHIEFLDGHENYYDKAEIYSDNFINHYIEPDVNFDAYRQQPVEAESMRRGELVRDAYNQVIQDNHTNIKLDPLERQATQQIINNIKRKYPNATIEALQEVANDAIATMRQPEFSNYTVDKFVSYFLSMY